MTPSPTPRKTSEEWQKLKPETKVLGPDGWDRQNFQFSWYEQQITEAEYDRRLALSTVQMSTPRKKCEHCGGYGMLKNGFIRTDDLESMNISCPTCNGTGYAPDVAPAPAEGGEHKYQVWPDPYPTTPPQPASEQPVVERCRAYVTKVCGCECHIYTDQPWRHCITCAKYPAEMIAPSEQPTNNHKEQ